MVTTKMTSKNYNQFTGSQEKIILCYHNPEERLTKIDISRRTGLFYATVYYSVRELIVQKILLLEKDPHNDKKKPIKLTDKGVCVWRSMTKINSVMNKKS